MNMFTFPLGQTSTKGERTRERILDAAMLLFARHGYEATTMREIAATTGVSLGLAYRYFPSKEALVLAHYERLAHSFRERAASLPEARVSERFVVAMEEKLQLVEPYRDAFAALFGTALNPEAEVAVLGEHTRSVRLAVLEVFREVVTGATDAPRSALSEEIAQLLYALHLGLLLVWLGHRGADDRTLSEALALARDSIDLGVELLVLPGSDQLLHRLAGVAGGIVGVAPMIDDSISGGHS